MTHKKQGTPVIAVGMTVGYLAACVPLTTEAIDIAVVTVKATKAASSVVSRTQAVRF